MVYLIETYTVLPGKRDAFIERILNPCIENHLKTHYSKVVTILGVFENIYGGEEYQLSIIAVWKDLDDLAYYEKALLTNEEEQRIFTRIRDEGPWYTKYERKVLTSTEFNGMDWESLR